MKGIKIYNFTRTNNMKNFVLKNDENIQLKYLSNQLSKFSRSNSSTNLKLKDQNNNNIYIKKTHNNILNKEILEHNNNKEIIINNNSIDYEEKINKLEKRISELEETIKKYEELFKTKELNSSGNFPFNNITNLNEIDIRLNELENQINSIQMIYKQNNSNEDTNKIYDLSTFSKLKNVVEQNSNDLKIIIEEFNDFNQRTNDNFSKLNESINQIYQEISFNKENFLDLIY
jgi:predicted RNase H-like nuclease (RuvC/YqgF family)